MNFTLVRGLKDQLSEEHGYYRFAPGARERFALVYPNSYYVGMSNLGLHVIYDLLNRRTDTACERVFLPEPKELSRYQNTHTPIMSLENQTPLYEFPLIGFAISFEMDYFHVLTLLQLGKVKLRARERTEKDPVLIAGGPCATFNPEPLAAVFDAFIIGEGEAIMPAFMDTFYEAKKSGASRIELLKALSKVPGVYVPSLYHPQYADSGQITQMTHEEGAPSRVSRQWVKNLDEWPAHTVVVTDQTEFNLYLIETARGCGRHCRFCMAGYCFRRPRNRSLKVIEREVEAAIPFHKRIGLMGAAISDYPQIDALCQKIQQKGMTMSVASFRADSVTEKLVRTLADSGLRTLTLAPEAGSKRLRKIINKGIEEGHLFHTIDLGISAGIENFRLYFMIGLPEEEEEDIEELIELSNRIKDYMEERGSKGLLTLSINPFIPKPFTPFSWEPMCERSIVERRLKKIKAALRIRKHIHVIAESSKESYIQGILSRGDRRVGEALLLAQEHGGWKSMKRAMKEQHLDPAFFLYRQRAKEEIFPWDHLDMGVRKAYLYQELQRAKQQEATIPCFEGCQRCGVCR